MERLNLLRKAIRYFEKTNIYNDDQFSRRKIIEDLKGIKAATKFILPDGGLYMENDDLPSIIKLPYLYVLLEFKLLSDDLNPEAFISAMVAAYESKSEIDLDIWFCNRRGEWTASTYGATIPAITTNVNDNLIDFIELYDKYGAYGDDLEIDSNPEKINSYFAARCLINFMLFLDMTNIFVDKKYDNKPKKGERLSAHLHDSYHILKVRHHKTGKIEDLTYDRVSRSPRQHYRRGHLRRRKFSQDKIWINSVIVNKGWKGKVSKDYELCENQGMQAV